MGLKEEREAARLKQALSGEAALMRLEQRLQLRAKLKRQSSEKQEPESEKPEWLRNLDGSGPPRKASMVPADKDGNAE